ncbi:MAG: dienelactone hydrolase family protein [Hyphomicrobiales bacterium]|nr:dienelactone hydrolase family protein [Hyphomicrobiales bacterium]
MGSRITYKRPDGKDAAGYHAAASSPGAPGLVVIQEWWGLNDQIKGICDRFAAAGFNVIAPDLYAGRVVPYHDREAANTEMTSLNFLEATDQVVRGAAQKLKGDGSAKVGITGFCMGGAMTILGAARVPEFSAGAPFYGLPPAAAAGPADVKIPLQGHFALHDDWCTPEAVKTFDAGLKKAGKTAEIFEYDAHHGFMNEARPDVHQEKAAREAWDRVVAFFRKQLG